MNTDRFIQMRDVDVELLTNRIKMLVYCECASKLKISTDGQDIVNDLLYDWYTTEVLDDKSRGWIDLKKGSVKTFINGFCNGRMKGLVGKYNRKQGTHHRGLYNRVSLDAQLGEDENFNLYNIIPGDVNTSFEADYIFARDALKKILNTDEWIVFRMLERGNSLHDVGLMLGKKDNWNAHVGAIRVREQMKYKMITVYERFFGNVDEKILPRR